MFKNEAGESGGQIETLIGEKSRITGDIVFSGGLHIDGEVEGSVSCGEGSGIVHLSESSLIRGELRAPVVVVNGKIEGDVYAEQRIELHEKARVSGNVHYKAIEMRLGAEVNGQLKSTGSTKTTAGTSPGGASATKTDATASTADRDNSKTAKA